MKNSAKINITLSIKKIKSIYASSNYYKRKKKPL